MEAKIPADLQGYERIAGHPCLDFANTVGGSRRGEAKEYLKSYAHLVSWGQLMGYLTPSRGAALRQTALQNPALAAEVLARAHALREAIYRVVTSKTAAPEDLFLISREAAFALGRARLSPGKEGFTWVWPETDRDLDCVLWPVARAAGELLTSPSMAYVRGCGGDTCTWVFLDTSKNHRRRWCVMKDCGNRAKVRRFRHQT